MVRSTATAIAFQSASGSRLTVTKSRRKKTPFTPGSARGSRASGNAKAWTGSVNVCGRPSQRVRFVENLRALGLGVRSGRISRASVIYSPHRTSRSLSVACSADVPPRSEEHTSELQSHSDLHSFPTRRLFRSGVGGAFGTDLEGVRHILTPSDVTFAECSMNRSRAT